MTDDMQEHIATLSETVGQLRESVDHQATSAITLAERVTESNALAEQTRRILRVLTFDAVAKMIVIVLVIIALVLVYHGNQVIKDCTSPGGKCAQRNAVETGLVLNIVVDRIESNRLASVIEASKASGNTAAADVEEQQKSALDAKIGQETANLHSLQTRERQTS